MTNNRAINIISLPTELNLQFNFCVALQVVPKVPSWYRYLALPLTHLKIPRDNYNDSKLTFQFKE